MTVILTLGPEGEILYNVTAPCNEWSDSGGKITIAQRDGEFVITDSLPDG